MKYEIRNNEITCLVNHFYFISNDNITRDFFCQDSVNFSKYGTCILAGYFLDFINAVNNF